MLYLYILITNITKVTINEPKDTLVTYTCRPDEISPGATFTFTIIYGGSLRLTFPKGTRVDGCSNCISGIGYDYVNTIASTSVTGDFFGSWTTIFINVTIQSNFINYTCTAQTNYLKNRRQFSSWTFDTQISVTSDLEEIKDHMTKTTIVAGNDAIVKKNTVTFLKSGETKVEIQTENRYGSPSLEMSFFVAPLGTENRYSYLKNILVFGILFTSE